MRMSSLHHLFVGAAVVAALVSCVSCGSARQAERPLTQPVVPGIYSVRPDGSDLELLVQRPSVTVPSFNLSGWEYRRTGTTSRDGRRLAYSDRDVGQEIVRLLDVASRESRQLAIFDELEDLAWAPEGNAIAVLGRQGTQKGLFLLDADTGVPRQVLSACPSDQAALSWARDGGHVALSDVSTADGGPPEAGPACAGGKSELMAVNLPTGQVTSLGEGDDAAWSPDGSTVAFVRGNTLYRQSFPPTAEPEKLAETAASPSWSPDGRTLAFSRSDGVYAIAADGNGSEVRLAGGDARQPTWAPDGRSVTFVRRGEVFVVDAGGGGERLVASSPFPFLQSPDWLADGRILFSLALPTDSGVYLAASDGSGQRYAGPGEGPLAWSPDGRRIAFRTEFYATGFTTSGGVYVLEPESAKTLFAGSIFFFTDSLSACYGSRVAWSPDGSRIAFSGPQSGTQVFDVSRGTQAQELKDMYLPSWSSDGTTLVAQSADGGWCQINLVNLESGESRRIAEAGRPSWSPDGKWVAFDARYEGVTLFSVQSETKVVVESHVQELTWSPDSSRLAFVDRGHIFVAGVAAGENAREIAEGEQIAWSPDGRTLAFAKTVLAPDRYAACGAIAAVDVESGVVRELPGGGAHPRWSPDGKVLAFEAGNAIYAVNPDAPSAPRVLAEGSSVAWSPDGAHIAFVRRHGTSAPVGPPACPGG